MKNLFFVLIILGYVVVPARAQKVTQEHEVTLGATGVSQYVFVNGENYNASFRYVFVRNGVHRLETGIGPTIHPWGITVKWSAGLCSDASLRLAQVVVVPIRQSIGVWIADAKLGKAKTLYQKVFVPLTAAGTVQLRFETLTEWVKVKTIFVRISVEGRLSQKVGYLYAAPFVDLKNGGIGANVGYGF